MRQMWNKCGTLVASFILDILLPLIFSVIFFGVIDFTSLTTSTTVDLASVFGKVRTNRSIFDLIASMQNSLSLLVVFCAELVGCIKYFNKIQFWNLKIDVCHNNNEFFAIPCKEFTFNKTSVTYLRI